MKIALDPAMYHAELSVADEVPRPPTLQRQAERTER